MDEAGVTVTATGFEDGFFGPVLNIHIVNDTDRLVSVGCSHYIINGYSADAYLSTEVQPGSEADDTISIYDASLDLLGTEYIGIMELQVFATDENYDRICTGDIVVLRTTDYDKDWAESLDGDVIFSEDGLTVKLVRVDYDDTWQCTDFTILLQNANPRSLSVEFPNMLVNGEASTAWFYKTVFSGTSAIGVLSIYDDTLGESGVLESVEISIVAHDEETYEDVIKTLGFLTLPVGVG